MKKIYAFILSLLCMIGMSLPVYAADNDVTLTVTGLNSGDKFKLWRVVEVNHDTATNNVTYAWNNDFKNYFEPEGEGAVKVTVTDFVNYTSNSTQLNALLAGLPSYIRTNLGNTQPLGNTQTANEAGQIIVNNLTAGCYFLEPVETTEVYQPIFVSIVPTIDEQTNQYVYKDKNYSVSSKHTQSNVTKQVSIKGLNQFASGIGVSKPEVDAVKSTFTYRITMDVPRYVVSPYTNSIQMTLEDQLPSGVTLVSGTITFKGHNGTGTETSLTIPAEQITTADGKITVNLAPSYSELKDYSKIVMEYDAQLNDTAALYYVDTNKNTATYTYSKYPYAGNYTDTIERTASANVYTYTMSIDKIDVATASTAAPTKLPGAKFTLLREKTDADTGSTVAHDGKQLVVIKEDLVTNDNGQINITGLADGEYYLQETKAPTGYVLDNEIKGPYTISLNTDGNLPFVISNRKGLFTLPETGSTGKLLYSLAGLALASIATICLIVVYKKGKKG